MKRIYGTSVISSVGGIFNTPLSCSNFFHYLDAPLGVILLVWGHTPALLKKVYCIRLSGKYNVSGLIGDVIIWVRGNIIE